MTKLNRKITAVEENSEYKLEFFDTKSVKLSRFSGKAGNEKFWFPIATFNRVKEDIFPKEFLHYVAKEVLEAFKSKAVNQGDRTIVAFNNCDKNFDLIYKIFKNDDLTSLEKTLFTLTAINFNFHYLEESFIDRLLSLSNKEADYPNNYFYWSEDCMIYSLLPIIEEFSIEDSRMRLPSFSNLKRNNKSTNDLSNFQKALDFISFISNDEYSADDDFESRLNEGGIFEVPKRVSLRSIKIANNWIGLSKKNPFKNSKKKFLKILQFEDFQILYNENILKLIGSRIERNIIPKFFEEEHDDPCYQPLYFDRSSFYGFSSLFLTREEMNSIKKTNFDFEKFINNDWGSRGYGSAQKIDLKVKAVRYIDEVGVEDFVELCHWWEENAFNILARDFEKVSDIIKMNYQYISVFSAAFRRAVYIVKRRESKDDLVSWELSLNADEIAKEMNKEKAGRRV